jgi:hypothetical protein
MSADPYTSDHPYTRNLTDANGWMWQFAYWGSGKVYIRDIPNELSDPLPPIGEDATRDDWPFLIDLNYYGMRPEDVTAEWLRARAAEWITDRNDDLASGNITI